MRVLLIEDNSATAQSIELMLSPRASSLVIRSWSAYDFESWKRPTGQLLVKHCVVPIRRIGFWHPQPQEKHSGQGHGCDAQKSRRTTKAPGNEAC